MGNKRDRVGETRRMNNGLMATIIEYNSSLDATVCFEDGTIREHVKYDNFRLGNVSLTSSPKCMDYIGMTKQMNNGHMCTITKVDDYQHIEVTFENGAKTHSSIHNFRIGKIGFPVDYKRNIHLGERRKQKCGLIAEVIKFPNHHDVTVKFENGMIREHVYYNTFKRGELSINKRVCGGEGREGQSFLQNNGLLFTITEYRSATDIDGVFETGEVRKHIPFTQVKNGTVCLHALSAWQEEYLGKQFLMDCGLHITVTKIVDCEDVTIRFDETGEIAHVRKPQIDAKQCLPCGLSMKTRASHDFCGYRVFGRSVKVDDLVFYHAVDLFTGKEALLTPQMMVESRSLEEKTEEEYDYDL